MKTVIIGNSGSGKTWLAERLAEADHVPLVHLDDLYWEPGGFDRKRPKEQVLQLVEGARENPSWIVEGVFGELAKLFLDRADFVVWLDLDADVCRKRLAGRGSESKMHMGREESEEGLRKLILWASHYHDRTDLRSYVGHKSLFQQFSGRRILVQSEESATRVAEYARRNTAAGALTHFADLGCP